MKNKIIIIIIFLIQAAGIPDIAHELWSDHSYKCLHTGLIIHRGKICPCGCNKFKIFSHIPKFNDTQHDCNDEDDQTSAPVFEQFLYTQQAELSIPYHPFFAYTILNKTDIQYLRYPPPDLPS